jgi:MmyB-like transcription regulator ligand binding domain
MVSALPPGPARLSTQSDLFRLHWASHNVKFHPSGRNRLRHPAVGELDLNFEVMELPSELLSNEARVAQVLRRAVAGVRRAARAAG